MLRPVLGSGHFKHIGNAQQRLLSVSVRNHLKNCEIFQNTIHHVLFWEVLELENKVDHVLTHGTSMDFVWVTPSFISCILSLNF